VHWSIISISSKQVYCKCKCNYNISTVSSVIVGVVKNCIKKNKTKKNFILVTSSFLKSHKKLRYMTEILKALLKYQQF